MALECFCGGSMAPDVNEEGDRSNLTEYFTIHRHECRDCGAITMTDEDFKKSKESYEHSRSTYGEY